MSKHVQRILSFVVLAALLSCLLPPSAAAAGRFTDVPASHWASSQITRAVDLGLFQGETSTRFGLGHPMTRAAFAVVLCRFFDWEMVTPDQGSYTDNQDPNAWYYSAVETAYAHGAITSQTSDFRPADSIAREELAVMLLRAMGYGTIAGLAQDLPIPFRDVRTNSGYLSMAYALGLISGTSATTFSPDQAATREQAAVILMRLYDKLHAADPGRVGIIASAGDDADFSGFDAVAVDAGRLSHPGHIQLSHAMKEADAAALTGSIQEAGAKALFYVTGSASALKGDAAETAAILKEAVEDGGYDGLFLDLPRLGDASKSDLTALVRALREALGERLLYVMAEAPAWQGTSYGGYDYAALGASADRLVLRVAAYQKESDGFPIAPLDPPEEVYYALGELKDTVSADRLSLLVTTTATAWDSEGDRTGTLSGEELQELLEKRGTTRYYSTRYACAYLTSDAEDARVVWFLDETSLAERTQLAKLFGVSQLCLSDMTSLPTA